MKQTAVEWYKNELNKIELTYLNKVIDRKVYMDLKSEAFEQANKMFEVQIKDAFEMGQINVYENHNIDSDDYYQLNFKSE